MFTSTLAASDLTRLVDKIRLNRRLGLDVDVELNLLLSFNEDALFTQDVTILFTVIIASSGPGSSASIVSSGPITVPAAAAVGHENSRHILHQAAVATWRPIDLGDRVAVRTGSIGSSSPASRPIRGEAVLVALIAACCYRRVSRLEACQICLLRGTSALQWR